MPIGITAGDASGVGPEILIKAWSNGQLAPPFVVFGDLDILEHCNNRLGYSARLRRASDPTDIHHEFLNVINQGLLRREELVIGEVDAASGRAAREYVIAATQAALAGDLDAVVTLPMNKEATRLSDSSFTGHTELIGEICHSQDVTIMLHSSHLIVTHVSTHVSLSEAIQRVKKDRVCRIIELTVDATRRLCSDPRIAVAGLNPHAGEHSLFGDEEMREIEPAVSWAQNQGMPVDGPFPPDTLFYQAVRKKRFDAIVCMYHDQGHVPLKLLDFDGAVNVTLGLPIVRTSVDHGTAFDIAWKGVAKTTSLTKAVELAVKLAAPVNDPL